MKFINENIGRLDKILTKLLDKPRNQIEQLIKIQGIMVDEKHVTKSSYKLVGGENISVEFPEVVPREALEVNFDVDILYEDDDILVINKPSGVIIHPAPSVKEATLVDWLIKRGISLSTISGEERHGIVHRIDKETTGALVIAKNNDAHASLSAQLEDKSMGRFYLALIDIPLIEDIVVDAPIKRSPHNRLKMAVVESGRESKSEFRKIALSRDESKELIVAKLYSGRTHQIRVHLESLQRHVLGDVMYGYKGSKSVKRVMLHAYILYLKHPRSGEMLYIKAPLMDDFNEILLKQFDLKDDIQIESRVKDAFISA